ncbi:MAG: hypothetical protein WAW79_11185, partial [Steroidobacteraceae bacterium]
MRRNQLHPVELPPGSRNVAFEGLPVRSDEPECAIIQHLHHDLPFVQQPMMETAQQDEVGKLCFATLR